MTKEDWEKVEKALSGTYGYVKLMVDGREITFHRELITKNKLGIVTYVDGQWKAVWISAKETHAEQQYLCREERFVWTPKQRAELKKWPKKMLKKHGFNPDEKRPRFNLLWPSTTAIRRHYQKTFTSIELIEVVG